MSDNYSAKDAHEASSLLAALQKMKCDSVHYIGQSTCPRCLSTVHDALAAAIAVIRAEGYLAGLEAAAKECDERFILNDAIEPDDPMYGAALNRCAEAEECAAAIREKAKEGR